MFHEVYAITEFIVKAFIHIWPYLLLTVPISVIIHLSGTSRFISRAFSAKPLIAILLATIVGAFSPFCSCGVIPIISSLLIGGVPLAPVMSFWLASPSMDPEIFFLSVAKLGMPLAVARLSATFILSLGAGYITHLLMRSGWLPKVVLSGTRYTKSMNLRKRLITAFKLLIDRIVPKPALASIPASSSLVNTNLQNKFSSPGNCGTDKASSCSTNSDCAEKPVEGLFRRGFLDAGKTMVTVMKFMLLAFFLEALIILYVPENLIARLLDGKQWFAVPLSAMVGVPVYTTNLTALGLVSGLLNKGMNPGAALTFLIAGAMTTLPAMAAVFGLVKRRIFILYIGFAVAGSMFFGYLYNFILSYL
jgi:uncharacterized protein